MATSPIVLAIRLRGVRQIERALTRAPVEARARVAHAIRETAEEVAQGARARVPVRTGELRNTIRAVPTENPMRWLVSAGLGTLKRRSRRRSAPTRGVRARTLGPEPPGIYAMVVEFGSTAGRARQPAQPYMFPALEAARQRHLQRVQRALQDGAAAASRSA